MKALMMWNVEIWGKCIKVAGEKQTKRFRAFKNHLSAIECEIKTIYIKSLNAYF